MDGHCSHTTSKMFPVSRAQSARARKCYRPALRYYILELPGYILRPMLEVGLHFRNSCQHDHGFAGLIFRSRSDLIAGEIEGDAVALIGGRKMQRRPVDDDLSIPHAKKTPPKSIMATRTCPA